MFISKMMEDSLGTMEELSRLTLSSGLQDIVEDGYFEHRGVTILRSLLRKKIDIDLIFNNLLETVKDEVGIEMYKNSINTENYCNSYWLEHALLFCFGFVDRWTLSSDIRFFIKDMRCDEISRNDTLIRVFKHRQDQPYFVEDLNSYNEAIMIFSADEVNDVKAYLGYDKDLKKLPRH